MADVIRSPIGCTTEDRKPDTFVKWCAKNKVLWDKCTMAMSETTGRCVIAKQHIKKDEVVVEVPDDAVLMGENCQIQELLAEEGLLKPAEDALLEVQGLILGVMYEKALGKQSQWGPYLSFLPNDMSHMPIYWTDDELQELRGTAAYDKIEGRVQHPADAPTRMQQLFEELVLPFVQAHEPVCKVLLQGKGPDDVTEDVAKQHLWPLYQWSTAVVASYSFVLGDEQFQGMVPVWDLLNHVTGKVNVRLHHEADRGVLQMIATEDIAAGAEVINCYGHLSNSELLRGYGYVEQHNPVQHVHIPAQFLIRAAAAAAAGGRDKKQQRQQQQQQDVSAAETGTTDAEIEGQQSDKDDESPDQSGSDESSSSEVESSDHEDGDESSGGEDESSSSSSDEEEDEADWDLEDDNEQLQQQQQQPAPTLDKAQQQIADWEERWQLCFSLKLLPKNNVFQIPSGGLKALPQQLLPVLLLLLSDADDCQALTILAANGTSRAAAAADNARQHKTSKKQRHQAAAAGCDSLEAVLRIELAAMVDLQFCDAAVLHSALQRLVQLMQSRYTCNLSDDQQQLQQLQTLPPRLAAAVIARSGEKDVLQQLETELAADGVQQQLMQQARNALKQAVLDVAAAAVARHDDCCHTASCSHKHHHHHECNHDGHDAKQQQQQPKKRKQKQQSQPDVKRSKQQSSGSKAGAQQHVPAQEAGAATNKGSNVQQLQQQKKKKVADAGGFAFNFAV